MIGKMIFVRGWAILAVVMCSVMLQAQSLSTKKKKAIELYRTADKYRVIGQYPRAVPLLEAALKKDEKFIEAYFMLSVVYKYMRSFERSNEVLLAGLSHVHGRGQTDHFLFELGDNYLRQGNYRQALIYLDRYLGGKSDDSPKIKLAGRLKKNAEYGLAHKRDGLLYSPRLMSSVVNRFPMQYFPVLTADEQELIYTRRVSAGLEADEDLVVSKKDAKGNWMPPVSISKNINSNSNEGTCTISADGRFLIFTSCSGRSGYGSCDLFFSKKTGYEWSRPVNMGPAINSEAWESQPAMSADGMELYFTSEREDGYGGKDIYYSRRGKKDEWLPAKNIGPMINTPYDEISPFLHANGHTLFFSSTGRPGFGGYDVYKSVRQDKKWGEAVNFGPLINDYEDQFSLFVAANGEKAYYSYEKGVYRNVSKLVEVNIPKALRVRYKTDVLKGIVRDRKGRTPLYAHIELFDLKRGERVSSFESDSITGRYLVTITQGSDYAFYVTSRGYLFESLHFDYQDTLSPKGTVRVMDIDLQKAETGSTVVLNNLFFSVNQYELDARSKTELNRLVLYMTENPHLRIEIGGHTDDIGTDAYNRDLSLRRAHGVADFLIKKGVDKSRLVEKGYGSTYPLRPNDTEEHRGINRRTEIKILQLE